MRVPLDDASANLVIGAILLIPFAAAGMSLIDAGLGRVRSAAHTMFMALCAFSVAVLSFWAIGLAFEGALPTSSSSRGWLVFSPPTIFWRGVPADGLAPALFEALAVGLAALIPLGAALERWRAGACALSTAFLAAVIYPVFAGWMHGGGWLAQLGANHHLGSGVIDAGGSAYIHAVGGVGALAIAWTLGPRRGKFGLEATSAALPGHNAVLVLFGCLMALVGWFGVNVAGALLLAEVRPALVPLVAVNTLFSAAASAGATAVFTRIRYGKLDASLTANAWFAGLVAVSAGAPYVAPAAAVLIGVIAGLILPPAVGFLEMRLTLDDPGGAISAHGLAGLWGLVAVGLLANAPAQWFAEPHAAVRGWLFGDAGQLLAQWLCVAALLGFVLPLSYGFNALLNWIYPQRLPSHGERLGSDLHELGGSAYPEFVTHTEEFSR